MAPTAWMLELAVNGWQLHVDRDGERAPVGSGNFAENELLDQVGMIATAATEASYQGDPIVVALHAAFCLAASLSIDRASELRDRTTMGYRLEESIPWGAEEFVADYAAAEGCAHAVAVQREPIVQFLRQLEQRGLRVQCVVPLAILAAQAHFARGDWPEHHAVSLRQGEGVDLIWADKGRIVGWQSLSDAAGGVALELRRQAIESGQLVTLVEYGAVERTGNPAIEFVQRVPRLEDSNDPSVVDLAIEAIRRISKGSFEPQVDLHRHLAGRRRGNPALRRYAIAFQMAAAVLMACTIGSLLYRGAAVRRQGLELASHQSAVFKSVFPNAKVPVGIATRLRSELAKLQGLKGEDGTLPERISAIVILERLLKAVPTDKRFRLLEIRMEEGRLYLDGETRQHSDAESIAQRLRGEGFVVAPPKSQRLDDQRVSLRITGTMATGGKDATRKQ